MESEGRLCIQIEKDGQVLTYLIEADIAAKLPNDLAYRENFAAQLISRKNKSGLMVIEEPIDSNAEKINPSEDKDKDKAKSSNGGEIRWTNNEAQLLVSTRIEQDQMSRLNKTLKSLWDGIAKKMAKEGINYSGVQCSNKWKSLKRDYIAVIDHNSKSGNDPKRCKFYNEFNELYGNRPGTRPGFPLDSYLKFPLMMEGLSLHLHPILKSLVNLAQIVMIVTKIIFPKSQLITTGQSLHFL